jgi:DNA polymerase-3 subunit beta
VVPTADLLAAVKAGGTSKAAMATEVTITVDGTSGLVKVGSLQMPFRAHPEPENYPEAGVMLKAGEPLAEVVSDTFREAWTSVAFATSTDMTLPILTAVRLVAERLTGRLEFLATDRYRLARTQVVTRVEKDLGITIPGVLDKYLPVLLPGTRLWLSTGPSVSLNQRHDSLVISDGSTVIHQRLLDGDYPKVQSIIPDRWELDHPVDRDALLAEVKRVEPLVERNVPIKVALSREGLRLIVQRDGDYVEVASLPGTCDVPEPFEVGLNVAFLKDALTAFPKGSCVNIHATQPTRPIGFDTRLGHLTVIQMPVRFKS